MSKFAKAIEPLKDRLRDCHLLAVDPSSGSANSLPGYALFKAGKLIEAGVLEVPRSGPIWVRLQKQAWAWRECFEVPDVLAIEGIAPYINGGNSKATINLQRAVGVAMANIATPNVIEVYAASWRKHVKGLDNWNKTDYNDAILIGYACLVEAGVDMPPVMEVLNGPGIERHDSEAN